MYLFVGDDVPYSVDSLVIEQVKAKDERAADDSPARAYIYTYTHARTHTHIYSWYRTCGWVDPSLVPVLFCLSSRLHYSPLTSHHSPCAEVRSVHVHVAEVARLEHVGVWWRQKQKRRARYREQKGRERREDQRDRKRQGKYE